VKTQETKGQGVKEMAQIKQVRTTRDNAIVMFQNQHQLSEKALTSVQKRGYFSRESTVFERKKQIERKRNTDQVLLYSCRSQQDKQNILRFLGRESRETYAQPHLNMKVHKLWQKVVDPKV